MFTRKVLEVAGMVAVVAALGQLPAQAAVDLNTGNGSLTYATETLVTTGAVTAGSETYYVLAAPSPSGRLSFVAEVGRAVAAGELIQVRFNLGNMVFAGGTVPVLTVDGASAATISTPLSGGDNGDAQVRFSVTAGASEPIFATAKMRLAVRSVGVLVDRAGTVRVGTRVGSSGPFSSTDSVTAFRVASGLREKVTSISPVVKFADSFRTFAGKLVTNVGRVLVRLPPGTGTARVFSAADSAPASISNMLSATAGDSTVTFSGDLGFTRDAFLSDAADCSTKDEEGVLDGSGNWAPVNLVAANGKHLCIEVDGAASIPATAAYQAEVVYGGITDAAFPPGNADLVLGKVVREGVTVNIPFVDTHSSVNFRIVLTNRGSEPARYNFEFTPPGSTTAQARSLSEGALEPNSSVILKARQVVTVAGSQTYTAASLTVGASPEVIDIMTIQTNKSDGSTDTVRY